VGDGAGAVAAAAQWAATGRERREKRASARENESRAGLYGVKKSYLRRLRCQPSDITLSPTASYTAVGDKQYFRAPVVAVGHNLISDGLVAVRVRVCGFRAHRGQ
jgi:hypothetical protein